MISSVWAWRIAILWFLVFSINALGTSAIASLTGAKWEHLDTQEKILIVIGITVNWTNTIGAFLHNAVKKAAPALVDPGFDSTQTTP